MTSDTLDEDLEIGRHCEEAKQAEWFYQRIQEERWIKEQHKKAPHVLALIRQYVPPDALDEIEDFLSTGFGSKFITELLQREQERERLREELPRERWPDIEEYLDTGILRDSSDNPDPDCELPFAPRPAMPWEVG